MIGALYAPEGWETTLSQELNYPESKNLYKPTL